MPDLKLNLISPDSLLEFAKNRDISNEIWQSTMHDTFNLRSKLVENFRDFQSKRHWIEIAVKMAVSATLAVGLAIGVSSALLFGAAVSLALSSSIYAMINLNQYTYSVEYKKLSDEQLSPERKKWIEDAELAKYSVQENITYTNMMRIGLGIVTAFATFVSISSGADLLLTLGSVLFSSSFFLRQIDDSAPHTEATLLVRPQ
ncbi:MAG: hypothetical protein EBY16_09575 [Gammaproteobacteria bacterium]|nr:hypothetical protein [Gammaproteobacteria bacterium]